MSSDIQYELLTLMCYAQGISIRECQVKNNNFGKCILYVRCSAAHKTHTMEVNLVKNETVKQTAERIISMVIMDEALE